MYIFTDGSCFDNGYKNARAGIGIYFGEKDKRNVSEELELEELPKTNNSAELYAIYRALNICIEDYLFKDHKIVICTDS